MSPDAVLPALLLAHAAATVAMTGLIWFVQVVHYPLYDRVLGGFTDYEIHHMRRTGWVVGPLMLAETVCACAIVALQGGALAWLGLVLLIINWASTLVWQAPLHRKLAAGFDGKMHRALVRTNWVRTASWSARAVVALALLQTS